MKKQILLVFFFMLGPSFVFAQFRDTLSHPDTIDKHITSEDSAFPYHTKPNLRDIGLQFLAGEVAFNATSFSLWGDGLWRGTSSIGVLGIMAACVTVPLAMDLTSNLLNLKSESLRAAGMAVAGAYIGIFTIPILMISYSNIPRTYFAIYSLFSLSLITVSELFYDVAIAVL